MPIPEWLLPFHTEGFTPHASCITDPGVIAQHIVGDLLTALVYFLIPLVLFRIAWRSRFTLNYLFFWFGLFILCCGMTHLMDIVVLYYPLYVLQGWIKILTGIVSVVTLIKLIAVIPLVGPMDFTNIVLVREVSNTSATMTGKRDIKKAVKLRKLILDLKEYADKVDLEIT